MKLRRHDFVRAPALALLVLMVAAWMPCFACDGTGRDASQALTTRADCHGAGDLAGPSCGQEIRTAGTALRVTVPPAPAAVPVPVAASELPLFAVGAPTPELPTSTPISRPPLYLLHGSLLA